MKTALASGTKLVFGKGQNVIIQKVIGRGASCFVYNATYQDSIGILHNVRIKECYPYNISLIRKEDNSLYVLPNQMGNFEKAKAQFVWSYERNANIKRISELLNSTGTVGELFEANGTVYSILSYEEGKDYEQYQDACLVEVLEHIRAVAQVVQKYHENGYLHLDIKPENIFVFPETAQHIQLFDFDSVITMEELKKENVYIACSDGFSPPEQWQYKLDSIGQASDIYALGAVLFYKIFGRVPTSKDGNLDATYDFSNMIYKDDRYQPKLYKGLELLFRKSICTASVLRWDDMQLFIEQLEQLIPFADPNVVFVKENYSYHSNCFVGRREEIETLQEMLQEKKAVFLSGIGGIGKTELAKRYAYVNRERYDRIIFVSFCTSIKETICGNDIWIQNEVLEEGSLENLFETRMKVLKQDLTKNDLFILDNFDVEQEDDLEYLLQCRCKFIITSRNDFRDYNYAQMNVEKIEDEEELFELFFAYNQKEYCCEEWTSIYAMIHLVDSHTMTVELIAKYLRDIEELPSRLLQKMMEKEGITSLQEMKVKHRKDRKIRVESVNSHLLMLFHLFNFSEIESELLRSLSLLGYVRILQSSFLEYCNVIQKEESLEHLIKTGWIEYDENTKKISLHQIILDLVYNYMKPTAENCINLVEGISNYLLEELKDPIKKKNRSRLCRSFIERLKGNSLPYARLCILYGHYSNIPIAEQICLESKELEAKNLLYQIYRWKLRKITVYDDIFISKRNADSNYYENKIKEVLQLTKQALQYAKSYSLDKTYQLKVQTELAKELDLIARRPFVAMPIEYKEKMKKLLHQKIRKLYEEAEVLILDAVLDNKEKIALLEQILNFYYLGDFPIDLDKFYFYQQMKDMLKEKEGKENDFTDIKLEDVAQKAYLQGEYKKAFMYYKQVLEKGTESTRTVLKHIMDSCIYELKISNPLEQDIYSNIKQSFFNSIVAVYRNNKVISQDYMMKLKNNCNYYLIVEVYGQGKKISKQLDLWCWAAEKYYDIDKVKMNIKCLEKIITLLEKSNNLDEMELTKYWKYVLFLLNAYIKEQNLQKLKETAIRAYQIIINFFCKEEKIKDVEFDRLRAEGIFWYISDIAVLLEESGYREKALIFYMASIIVVDIGNILKRNQKVLKAVEEGMQGKCQALIDLFYKSIHRKLHSTQVTLIMQQYERMMFLLQDMMMYIEVKKELEWFSKKYTQQEFEFKREEW